MKILFICKYNRLRSKIAEALLRFYDKEKKHEVKSAGIRSYFLSPYIVEKAKKMLAQRGVSVEDEHSSMVNEYLIKWADKIIVVANDVESNLFPKEKTIVWEVSDVDVKEDKIVSLKIEEIDSKVKDLIENLNKNV